MRRYLLLAVMLFQPLLVSAAELHDATGRTIQIPNHPTRVLPAGPPAAVLLAALAPDLMLGWPHPPSPPGQAWLPDVMASLPTVPMLTGRQDVTDQVVALHPDLILDYGSISSRYTQVIEGVQDKTGIPAVLFDGALSKVPQVMRAVGIALHRQNSAELLAQQAEAILAAVPALQGTPPRVYYCRGPNGLVGSPGSGAAEVFAMLGWQVVTPEAKGTPSRTSIESIGALDPDVVIFQNAGMRGVVADSPLDPLLEDVAATLGHRPWAVFMRVSLPLAWRATAAGMLLAWLRAFGEFGATVMVAYHPYSLPVYTYVAFGSEGLPAMLPMLAPTLSAAIAVMIASHYPGTSAAKAKSSRIGERRAIENSRSIVRQPPEKAGQLLEFSYHRVVTGFELNVAWRTQVRRLAILGPSGSGKSMTLRLIAGLDRAESAVLHFDGHDLSTRPTEVRGVAYVPQSYGLFPHLTVARQVIFSPDADSKLAAHWMARLGLTGLEARHPNELSLGQQQRVAFARALARRADLLLLDEPFSALDAPLRARLRREFASLQQEFEATTILVTHDPTEAIALADEFLLLDAGRVLQTGPVEEVLLRPANEVVARLLGAANVGFGRAIAQDRIEVGDEIRLAVGGPALRYPKRIGWSVRPDRIRFADDGRYPVHILHVGDTRGGRRNVTIRLGNAQFDVPVDPSFEPTHMAGRVDIDPKALQIWTLGS